MTNIAVFGSAFNPPTLGHQSVITSLNHFDQIILVPSISHAWGKEMIDYSQRCQLVDAFIHDLNMTQVKRSDIESALHQPGQSVTTYAVMSALQQQFPDASLTFVIGPDNFLNFSRFARAKEILQQWSVMACPERLPIRSSTVRELLSQGKEITAVTTPAVARLLEELQLY